MIEKLIEKYHEFTNKKELEEMTEEYNTMKELLLFNLNNTDKFIQEVTEIIESDLLYYDQKEKIKELFTAYQQKKL